MCAGCRWGKACWIVEIGANEKSGGQSANSCREPLDAKRFQGDETLAEGIACQVVAVKMETRLVASGCTL